MLFLRERPGSLVLVLSSLLLGGASLACSASTEVTEPTPAPSSSSSTTPPPDETPTAPGLTAFTSSEVQALFDDRCVRCHNGGNATLDLSAFEETTIGIANAATTRRGKCSKSAHKTRIVAGDRGASLLWHKVKGTHDCGSPMPYESGDKPLDATELERLGLYIDALK